MKHAREYSSYVIKELLKHDTLRLAGSSDIVVLQTAGLCTVSLKCSYIFLYS